MVLHCETQKGSPPILYWFYHEDVSLGNRSAPAGGRVSFNFSVMAEHSGNYSCEAENGLGAQHSEVVMLNVTGIAQAKNCFIDDFSCALFLAYFSGLCYQ